MAPWLMTVMAEKIGNLLDLFLVITINASVYRYNPIYLILD
jgi:hypothetical protein